MKFRNFRNSWKSGKISDLSENFLYCKYSKSLSFRREVRFLLNWENFLGVAVEAEVEVEVEVEVDVEVWIFMRWR